MDTGRVAQALAANGNGVWEWDTGTGLVTWTAQLDVLIGGVGRRRTAAIDELIAMVDAPHRLRFGATLRAALRERSGFSIAHRIRRCDGHLRWVESHGAVLSRHERPTVVVATVVDVSERSRSGAREAGSAGPNRLITEDTAGALAELVGQSSEFEPRITVPLVPRH